MNIQTAKQFILEWNAKLPYGKPIHYWSEAKAALKHWQSRPLKYPTIEGFAQAINAKPREVVDAAKQLRDVGIKLAEKENESRYAPKQRKLFPYREFGEMLIRTKRPKLVASTFGLSDDAFIRRAEVLTGAGVTFPHMPKLAEDRDVPDWVANRMHLALYPHEFTPEQKRTIGTKYRVKRPKNKKTYYYNGTGNYRPDKAERKAQREAWHGKSTKWARWSSRKMGDTIAYLKSLG